MHRTNTRQVGKLAVKNNYIGIILISIENFHLLKNKIEKLSWKNQN